MYNKFAQFVFYLAIILVVVALLYMTVYGHNNRALAIAAGVGLLLVGCAWLLRELTPISAPYCEVRDLVTQNSKEVFTPEKVHRILNDRYGLNDCIRRIRIDSVENVLAVLEARAEIFEQYCESEPGVIAYGAYPHIRPRGQ